MKTKLNPLFITYFVIMAIVGMVYFFYTEPSVLNDLITVTIIVCGYFSLTRIVEGKWVDTYIER